MKVHLLDITIYDDDGWTWRTEEILEPTWGDIEVAIRRLDRFHYPFIWLYLNADGCISMLRLNGVALRTTERSFRARSLTSQ